MKTNIVAFLSLVKFPHTLFALPFALIGFVLGLTSNDAVFSWLFLLQILGAMVFARNSAMGFNRYIDRKIDATNPRTVSREIPAGIISSGSALAFVVINSLLFVAVAYSINILCFYLSFPALIVLLGYSYTKRFTWLCHYFLGLALAIAPVGAFISVTGRIELPVVFLFFAVLLWVSGFDIIYSLSDEEFDSKAGLNSVPQRFGKRVALLISSVGHALVAPFIVLFGLYSSAGILYFIGVAVFTLLLIYQHLIVKPDDLSRVNAAFFTSNGVASVLFACFTIVDLLINLP
jgi:4-hydroxybenzoate polyprenyltransferase